MSMEAILREKRKALGLTQEQVAKYLGVTTPAVNKWEKGATCPDITLLPALARLLKTDPNTLLDFKENLSDQEIYNFTTYLVEVTQGEGIARGFEVAKQKICEFPNCYKLLHRIVLTLDGLIIMADLTPKQKETYNNTLIELYEQLAKCEESELALSAVYMLASKWIAAKQYDKAQEMIDLLPDYNAKDKRGMQADIWSGQGEIDKASKLLEQKLTASIQDHQMTLCRLIRFAIEDEKVENAVALANCAKRECEAFELGAYWENIAPLELAMAQKNVEECLKLISIMFEYASNSWNSRISPLFQHIPSYATTQEMNIRLLNGLLSNLEQDPQYEFLREVPEFTELVKKYRRYCNGIS